MDLAGPVISTAISILAALGIAHWYYKKALRDSRKSAEILFSETFAEIRRDTKASIRHDKDGNPYKNIDGTFVISGGGDASANGYKSS